MDGMGSVDRKMHFTYSSNPDRTTLCQGDILEKTEELTAVLRDVHPYFLFF